MKKKEIAKAEKLTPQQRSQVAQKEVHAILKKHNCSMIARPFYRWRDDNTWSLVTNIEIIPNKGE